MNIIILSENQKQALFVQKGLQYENLYAEIVDIKEETENLKKSLTESDGVFILAPIIPDGAKIERLIENCRKVKNSIPIIVLAENSNSDIEYLLNTKGILGYFVRPFPFRNITNQMRYSIFMLKEKLTEARFILRDLELDIASHAVKINKTPIYLRNKEFSLLHFFMINKGKILSRNTILEHVWDRNTNILTNTVDVHVSQLRKKIEPHSKPKFIRTIPCSGYVFE